MAKWLASEVPEWVCMVAFLVGLPGLMLLLQAGVRRIVPHWQRGRHNDVAGVMLSAAVVVYSVAIGLCVVTLWGKLDDAHRATEAEATNLAAMVESSRVFDTTVQDRIRAAVIAYNRDVVAGWAARIRGEPVPAVAADLDALTRIVASLTPETEAQRAFVDDAEGRLGRASTLRTVAVRLARDQQLPDILWVAVLGGSAVVLGLCLTCGVRDGVLRRVLLAGVAATVGINLLLVVELNYPFYGQIRVGPDSYVNVVAELRN
jgi:hypothetical protein